MPNNGHNRREDVKRVVGNACDYLRSEGIAPRDYVEQLTGIDFFARLEDGIETQVERHVNYRYWDMAGPPSLVNPASWGKVKIDKRRALERLN